MSEERWSERDAELPHGYDNPFLYDTEEHRHLTAVHVADARGAGPMHAGRP